MKTTFSLLLSLLIVSILVLSCNSATVKKLTAEQIWAKYTNTYGNKEKIKGIQSYHAKLINSYGKKSFEIELFMKGKNNIVLINKYPNDTVTFKINGLKAIEVSKNNIRILDAAEIKTIKEIGNLYSEIDFVEKGYKFELIGKESLNDNEVYKIKVTNENNENMFYYIDIKTFYLLKIEDKFGESYFSDYKVVDGILCSFKGGTIQNGQESTYVKTELWYNLPIEDTFFEINN